MADRLDVYEDSSGAWRWRLVAANGRTIASSGESFSDHHTAVRAGHRATEGHPQPAPVDDYDPDEHPPYDGDGEPV